MRAVNRHDTASPTGRASARPARLHAWLKLAAGFLLVLLFIFGAGRLSLLLPGARHMGQVIEAHQLRATAIYYTDFDTSAEASESIRHSLNYPPRRQTSSMPASRLPSSRAGSQSSP